MYTQSRNIVSLIIIIIIKSWFIRRLNVLMKRLTAPLIGKMSAEKSGRRKTMKQVQDVGAMALTIVSNIAES